MLLQVGAAKTEEEVGYAAGVIESIFSITQLLTVFHWGALSDRIGRKPVLIMGCIGSSLSAIAFGLSRSFWALVITRSLNGVMNGNIGVLKAIVAEISDETNESRAFSFFPICLNVGILIASFIGGTFGSSAGFPNLTKTFPIFLTFPYLLPNLLAALLPAIVAVVAWIWLKETLPSKANASSASDTTVHDADGSSSAGKDDTSYKSLFTPHINAIMFSFAVLSLLGGAQSAIQPLFCFTPVRDGGLGFSEREIGISMSIRSVSTVLVQVLAFPWLQRTVGTLRLYRWLMILWIPTYVGLPFVNGLARVATNNGKIHGSSPGVWVGLSSTLLCSAVANMAFVCNLLMTNAAAPSRQLLGAINGYSQVLSSGVRIIGPGGSSILYAVSVSKHLLGGNLVWLVLGLTAVLGVVSGIMIRQS
ncbi:major facilitator superfamily domain-containing protein, partial [Kockovaella imperatae]